METMMNSFNETKPIDLQAPSLKRRTIVLAGSSAAVLPGLSKAQAGYPNKPVKLIIPFAPGGTTDIVGRLLASRLGPALGQPFVVENRAGAGGTVGAEVIAKSAPDGYTIGMGTVSTCGTAMSTYKNLKYDPRVDYTPIINIASVPGVIAVHPSFPAKNYAEFIKEVKSKPGRYNYAHSGAGGVGHMAMELFKFQTGLFMTAIGYRGAGPALNDVLGGTVPIIWDNLTSTLPHVKSGRLIPIGLANPKRIPQLPDLPTFAELGLKNYDATTWFGFVAPKGTPREIVNRLNSEVLKLLADPDFLKRIADSGAFPIGNTPEQFAAQINAEIKKWEGVAKFAKVVAE
jgi:tripartite-type tricarboxylate transporter receptor subunit TctC